MNASHHHIENERQKPCDNTDGRRKGNLPNSASLHNETEQISLWANAQKDWTLTQWRPCLTGSQIASHPTQRDEGFPLRPEIRWRFPFSTPVFNKLRRERTQKHTSQGKEKKAYRSGTQVRSKDVSVTDGILQRKWTPKSLLEPRTGSVKLQSMKPTVKPPACM